jgi:hypothetical protein
MMLSLILDTGPLLASIDARDESRAACAELLASACEPRVIPAPVVVELDCFLTRRSAPARSSASSTTFGRGRPGDRRTAARAEARDARPRSLRGDAPASVAALTLLPD